MQGIYEVIERDIISIGLGTKKYYFVNKNSIKDDILSDLLNEFKSKKIEIFILYIYNEFDIPCFIVCSRNKNTQSFVWRLCCHSNKKIALTRAITELVQSISALSDNGDLKQLNKQRSKAKTVLDEDKNFIEFDSIKSNTFINIDEETE